MSITNDTIDATIATLRETRDGLLQTEAEEAKQWDDKMAELTKIAHEWADKNGMGDSVEELMEELGLPGRPDYRVVRLGGGGHITLTMVLPYQHESLMQMPRVIDRFYETAVTQRVYLGTEVVNKRDGSDDCLCSHAALIDLLGYSKTEAVDSMPDGTILMIEADLSCDSPRCHHGDGEPVAQVPEVAEVEAVEAPSGVQHCTYPNHPEGEHQHVDDGAGNLMFNSDLSHSGDWGTSPWRTLPGTFIKMTLCEYSNHTPDVPHIHHRFDIGVVTMTLLDAAESVSVGERQEGVFMRRMPTCDVPSCRVHDCQRPL